MTCPLFFQHENTDETLPIAVWLIIVAIGAFTAFVAICSTIYATCWYRRHVVHYNVRRSSRYHDALQQSTMYRSRNSMQLSSQPGDMPLFAEEENFATNDDTLQGVPELPEQEESEALEMVGLAFVRSQLKCDLLARIIGWSLAMQCKANLYSKDLWWVYQVGDPCMSCDKWNYINLWLLVLLSNVTLKFQEPVLALIRVLCCGRCCGLWNSLAWYTITRTIASSNFGWDMTLFV